MKRTISMKKMILAAPLALVMAAQLSAETVRPEVGKIRVK